MPNSSDSDPPYSQGDPTTRPPQPQRDYEILIDGARRNLETRMTGVEQVIEERDRTYTERDRRYGERFDAQEKAVETALIAQEKAVNAAFAAAKEAGAKAETSTEKRSDKDNEFRAQLKDQNNTMLPRLEAEARFSQYQGMIDDLKTEMAARRLEISTVSSRQVYDDRSQVTQQTKFDSGVAVAIGVGLIIVGIGGFLAAHFH